MKQLLTIIFLASAICSYGQKKSLPSFAQVQRYNKVTSATISLTKINAVNKVTGDSTLSVKEINEVLRQLDNKLSPADHKLITKYLQTAIDKTQK